MATGAQGLRGSRPSNRHSTPPPGTHCSPVPGLGVETPFLRSLLSPIRVEGEASGFKSSGRGGLGGGRGRLQAGLALR